MRISINLATRPYADLGPAIKRLRIGMGALAVICLGLLLGLHAVHNKADAARARENAVDGHIAALTQQRQGYFQMMQQPQNARLLAQVRELNQLFDEKSFSWTLAMENLETVLPGGVMVTTLEPVRAKNGVTTLHLRVVGPHDLGVEMVRNMEQSQRFLHPRIVGENAESAGNGANQTFQPVSQTNRFNFDILTEYNPPTAEQRETAQKGKKHKETSTQAAPAPVGRRGSAPATHPPASRRPRLQPSPARAPRPATALQRRPIPGRLMSPLQRSKPQGGAR
ncbi:MAG: fimbrial assembly protein [Acidobacteriota bacterium]